MALSRSQSGPGGLSINTGSANSLFGSGTTPAATGGLFGNTQASKPAGGLFGAAATTAPQTGGLFGTATSQPATQLSGASTTTSQPQTGGLFGSAPATTQPQTASLFGAAQPQQSGGLFGNTSTSQPAQSSGLFGSATAQPAQTGGLFGSTAAASQPQTSGLFGAAPQQSGGLFGNNTSTQPAQSGGGLFGSNQPKPATSLFGAPQNQNQPQQSTMFSSMNQPQNQGGFGNTLGGGLGQSTNQQQSVPGVRIDLSNIRGTTRFNDLHEDLQKEFEKLDEIIQQQIALRNSCDAIMPSHESHIKQVPHDYEFCRRKKTGVTHNKESDSLAVEQIQKYIKADAESAKLSFEAIDNLKLPPQFHNSNIWSSKSSSGDSRGHTNGESGAQDIVGFFSKTGDELAATLSNYEKHINEIELHLRGVEQNSQRQMNALVAKKNGSYLGQDNAMDQLTGALRDFEEGLLGVASKVGAAKEGVTRLQLGEFTNSTSKPRNGNRGGIY